MAVLTKDKENLIRHARITEEYQLQVKYTDILKDPRDCEEKEDLPIPVGLLEEGVLIRTLKTNMNWEIMMMDFDKVQQVLEAAKQQFVHNCVVGTFSFKDNDGGPYESNKADFWGFEVFIPAGTDQRFYYGIRDMLEAVCYPSPESSF